MAYAKINSITNANMAKVSNVAKAAIGKIGSIDAPVSCSGFDCYAVTNMDTGYNYWLQSTTNLPQVFHHADTSQNWTVVHTWDHNKDEDFGAWTANFSSWKYLSMNYLGQDTTTLMWLFFQGHSGGLTSCAMSVTGSIDGKVTMTLTKTGPNKDDVKVYVNGGSAFTVASGGDDVNSLLTSAPNKFRIGYSSNNDGFPESGGARKCNDFAIFDGAFSEAEATEAYNSGTTLDLRTHSRASDLEHYWLMGDGDDGAGNNDGTGDVIFDMAGDCDLAMGGIDATDIVTW